MCYLFKSHNVRSRDATVRRRYAGDCSINHHHCAGTCDVTEPFSGGPPRGPYGWRPSFLRLPSERPPGGCQCGVAGEVYWVQPRFKSLFLSQSPPSNFCRRQPSSNSHHRSALYERCRPKVEVPGLWAWGIMPFDGPRGRKRGGGRRDNP